MSPSSRPTGYGIAATAMALWRARCSDRDPVVLLEALGGVSTYAIEALTERFGIDPQRIIAFDPNATSCKRVKDRFGIRAALPATHDEFYQAAERHRYDVWINNGLGNNTTPAHVDWLLGCGVGVFCGAANNLLEVRQRDESLRRVFASGAWAWPDEAGSGGGWTLAVTDLYMRCQGLPAADQQTDAMIEATIVRRNENLVNAVLKDSSCGAPMDGRVIWGRVNEIIDERVARTLAQVSDVVASADVTRWPPLGD